MDAKSGNWRPLAAAYGEGVACPAREAAVMVAALLADLTRYHRGGTTHGAIDPTHVLVAEGGRAKLAEPAAAPAAAYQPPEVHAGQKITTRGDLFAAGVVLYRLLTGINPFEGSAALVKQRITNMVAPRPSEVKEGVPHAFDAVVERALAKKPEERYASAESFAEALMQALVPASASGQAETLATTVVRRPAAAADETVMRGPGAKAPDPDATVLRAPAPSPDETVLRTARSTTAAANTSAAAPPPPAAPAKPASGGGKGMAIGIAVAVLAALAGAALFFIK